MRRNWILFAILSFLGCSAPEETGFSSASGDEIPKEKHQPLAVVRYAAEPDGVMFAVNSGMFEVKNNCLFLNIEGVSYIPVFIPSDYVATDQDNLIINNIVVPIGAPFGIAGGALDNRPLLQDGADKIIEKCGKDLGLFQTRVSPKIYTRQLVAFLTKQDGSGCSLFYYQNASPAGGALSCVLRASLLGKGADAPNVPHMFLHESLRRRIGGGWPKGSRYDHLTHIPSAS